MDIHPVQPLAAGQLQQGVQMLNMGVDAAVGQQAAQVQPGPLLQAVIHRLVIGFVGKERAILDGTADAGQILKHHPAAADVGVAYLTVAHLPLRQAHVQSAGGQGGVSIIRPQAVQHRGIGQTDGVAGAGLGQAEAVHDDESSRRFTHSRSSRRLIPDWRR